MGLEEIKTFRLKCNVDKCESVSDFIYVASEYIKNIYVGKHGGLVPLGGININKEDIILPDGWKQIHENFFPAYCCPKCLKKASLCDHDGCNKYGYDKNNNLIATACEVHDFSQGSKTFGQKESTKIDKWESSYRVIGFYVSNN